MSRVPLDKAMRRYVNVLAGAAPSDDIDGLMVELQLRPEKGGLSRRCSN